MEEEEGAMIRVQRVLYKTDEILYGGRTQKDGKGERQELE